MSKRFIDTNIWKDPWFRKLKPEYKMLWLYLCSECDNSGVWKKDLELASFILQHEFDAKLCLEFFNKEKPRIQVLKEEYWLITDFVRFQFGELKEASKPHLHVLRLINQHRVSIGYPNGIHTIKEKDKDKDKDQDKENERLEASRKAQTFMKCPMCRTRILEEAWAEHSQRCEKAVI